MRVKDCQGCKNLTRRVWSSYYKPMAYHAIGISHAYAYCEKHKDRVLNVKNCKEDEK